ncbi:MAG: hypothetical protein A2W28_00635 [Gammaproteobacteria bacterium RBG_16_51_14]|nr:MAG: hypothetical protein A2W28_00635 [Gammaproteobacteria bacterium RBG_16_51_14]
MALTTILSKTGSRFAEPFNFVFSSNLFAAGLGFLAVLLISHKLSVAQFGLFSIALSVPRALPSVITLGLDTSMTKLASSYLGRRDLHKAAEVVATTLRLRFFTATLAALLIFLTAQTVSIRIFHAPNLTPLLRIASLGVLFSSLLDYFKSVFWTYQWFKKSFFLQLAADSVKLCLILLFSVTGLLNTDVAVAAFSLAPAAGVLLGIRAIPKRPVLKTEPFRNLFLKLFSHSKWIFLAEACRNLSAVAGLFLVATFMTPKAAGIYGLASNLTYLFPILLASLKAVFLPHVARFNEKKQFEQFLKKSLNITLCAGLASIPLTFISGPVITFFFGARYNDAVPIFNALLLAYVVLTAHSSVQAALYSLNKLFLVAIVDVSRLILIAIGTYVLIPPLGLLAPPLVLLIVNLISFCFLFVYAFKVLQHKKTISAADTDLFIF